MATKKIRISKEQLPPLGAISNRYEVDGNLYGEYKYYARYRIISEDRNRNSAWSPIYNLSLDNVIDFNETKFSSATVTGDVIKNVSIGWVIPQDLSTTFYDVYLKPGLYTKSKSIDNNTATIKFDSQHNFVSGNTVIVSGVGDAYDGVRVITQSGLTPDSFIRFATTGANETEAADTDGRVVRYTANDGYTYNATVPSPFYQVSIDGNVYDFVQIKVQIPTEVKNIDSKALLKESDRIAI